jgi:hypothetical protein
VAWEVEAEAEMVDKLQGAYVGFLAESHELQTIQNNFLMDGYHNLKVIWLGYRKVLLISTVVGEVAELVGSVGWWCTWFERFEAWSPDMVSNQRSIWLRCFGIPLHAWGEGLFRTIGFKFGSFLEVDSSTKNMLRGDLARINIITDRKMMIDSSVSVTVLGKKFTIRVLEEVGGDMVGGGEARSGCGGCRRWRDEASMQGSGDGGSARAVVEGLSEEGSDGDWSENGQVLHGLGSKTFGKGQQGDTRLEGRKGTMMTECSPNILGNLVHTNAARVNVDVVGNLATCDRGRTEGDNTLTSQGMLVSVPIPGQPRDQENEGVILVGPKEDGKRRVGLTSFGPSIGSCDSSQVALRTKYGDLPLGGFVKQGDAGPASGGGVFNNSGIKKNPNHMGFFSLDSRQDQIASDFCEEVGSSCEVASEVPCIGERRRKSKSKKNNKKQSVYHHGNKFLKFQEYLQNKRGRSMNRKEIRRGSKKLRNSSSSGSDPIRCSESNDMGGGEGDRRSNGILLEVVLHQDGVAETPQLSTATSPVNGVTGTNGSSSRGQGGEDEQLRHASHSSGTGRVDRDSTQTHHIIDILEDVGMHFKGAREEDVNRIIELEKRDRSELVAWEQRQVSQ